MNKKAHILKVTEDRITIGTWSPKENTFAVAKGSSLFLFTEKRNGNQFGNKSEKSPVV
jgi:hypothetical protein